MLLKEPTSLNFSLQIMEIHQ